MSKRFLDNDSPSIFFSLIIPYRENPDQVRKLLKHLEGQTYPKDAFEVVLIDNSITSSHVFFESKELKITHLHEQKYEGSPYSARNRGIEKAEGKFCAFIDANSYPDDNWLLSAHKCLQFSEHEIVAGAVEFEYGGRATPSKIADSLTSIQMERSVMVRNVAYTANLFIRRDLFEQIGLFEEGVRSGGDVRFCKKAGESGVQISYCKDAVVYKEARSFKALISKKIRTGRGYYYTWITEKKVKDYWFSNLFRVLLKPPSITTIWSHPHVHVLNVLVIWILIYKLRIMEQLSFIREYFRRRITSNR